MTERVHTNDEQEIHRLSSVFTYHAPKGNQPERYVLLRGMFRALALAVNRLVPPGREKALALTKLQEASQMANAGIAIGESADNHSGIAAMTLTETDGYTKV